MDDNPFLYRLKNKTSEELEDMLDQPSNFKAEAIQAARHILEKRKAGDKAFEEPAPVAPPRPKKKSLLLSKLNTSVKSIAVYQILTGICSVPILLSYPYNSPAVIAICIIFLIIGLFDILAGILLFLKKEQAISISLTLQFIHLVFLSANGFIINNSGFLYLYFIVGSPYGFGTKIGIIPDMTFLFETGSALGLGVNIVALLAIAVLFRCREIIQKEGAFTEQVLEKNLFKN